MFDFMDARLDLCLDFTNTVDWHASDEPIELLGTYEDLVRWVQEAGYLTSSEADRLVRIAEDQPVEAGNALAKAREVRETIFRIFVDLTDGEQPENTDLDLLNGSLTEAMSGAHIQRDADGFAWGWGKQSDGLDAILGPIVRSAGALLASDQLDRVGQCADDRGCGYLFLDTSKNRSRRWCTMENCGNRAKQRRFHQRRREDG